MNNQMFTNILYTKVQRLISMIKEGLNINFFEAGKLLYNSQLYKALEKEETKMWYYSSYALYNMFIEEKNW